MIFLDSNVFVAFLKEKDEFKACSEKIFSKLDEGKLSANASIVTLMEVAYVMRKLGMQDKIPPTINSFLSVRNLSFLPLTPDVFESSLNLLKTLGLGDALIATTALENGFKEIVTSDGDFKKISDLLTIKDPKNV